MWCCTFERYGANCRDVTDPLPTESGSFNVAVISDDLTSGFSYFCTLEDDNDGSIYGDTEIFSVEGQSCPDASGVNPCPTTYSISP